VVVGWFATALVLQAAGAGSAPGVVVKGQKLDTITPNEDGGVARFFDGVRPDIAARQPNAMPARSTPSLMMSTAISRTANSGRGRARRRW
jgi:hypothetical protein